MAYSAPTHWRKTLVISISVAQGLVVTLTAGALHIGGIKWWAFVIAANVYLTHLSWRKP
jgi:hypothetical protein